MLRKVTALFGAAAVFALAPLPAQSQIYLGPEVAWNDDADLGVGAGVEFDLPSLYPGIAFHGDFLYFFPGDDVDYFEFNANLTYDFPLEDAPVVPFALAGLNIGRASYDGGSELDPGFSVSGSETEVGFNVGGGVKFNAGSFQPRVAARFVLGGFDGFTIFAMLPFRVAN